MIPAHLVEQLSTALARWGWPLRQPTDARVDARARSTTPKPVSFGRRGTRPLTSQRYSESRAPRCTGISRTTPLRDQRPISTSSH